MQTIANMLQCDQVGYREKYIEDIKFDVTVKEFYSSSCYKARAKINISSEILFHTDLLWTANFRCICSKSLEI